MESSAQNGNPLHYSADTTLGAVLIGNIVAAILFGILTVQVYLYARRFKQDPRWIKCLVASVWTLDLAHTICTASFGYIYLVVLFSHPQRQALGFKVLGACLQLEPATALLVQLYFARRHWILNKKSVLSGAIVLLAFVAFGFGIGSGAVTYGLSKYEGPVSRPPPYFIVVWLAGSALVDILVTISVVWTLWSIHTDFRPTVRLIMRIIIWTISTGLLTALMAILNLVFFIIYDHTLIHLTFNFILAKLYSNTLLAALSHRQSRMKGEFETPQTRDPHIPLCNFKRKKRIPGENETS